MNIFLALIILLGLKVLCCSSRVILIWPPLKSLGTVWEGKADIIVDSWVIWTYLKMFKLGGHDVSAFRQLLPRVDILFLSNHNVHKSLCGLCFWASESFNWQIFVNLSIKGSEAQKRKPHKLLWMLWFDKKVCLT